MTIPDTVKAYLDAGENARIALQQLNFRQRRMEVAALEALTEGFSDPDFKKLDTDEGRAAAMAGAEAYVSSYMKTINPNYDSLDPIKKAMEQGVYFGGVTTGKFAEHLAAQKSNFSIEELLKDKEVQAGLAMTQKYIMGPQLAARSALTPEDVLSYTKLVGEVDPKKLVEQYDIMAALVDVYRKNKVVPPKMLEDAKLI